jgi:membrane protease subunit HflC
MKKHIGMVVLAALVVAALLLTTVSYRVDELRDVVLLKRFGRITEVHHPANDPQAAGLKFKWPWPVETVVRYDGRAQLLETPMVELTTRDQYAVLATLYCTWRIADPLKFYGAFEGQQSSQTMRVAAERLRQLFQQCHSDVLVRHPLSDLVNTTASKIGDIETEILAQFRPAVEAWGVDVSNVGLKVLSLTEAVSAKVVEAQREARIKEADRFRTSGESIAEAIRERARRDRDIIIAFAKRKASELVAEGAAQEAEVYRQLRENERLAMFLRTLRSLKEELQNRAVIVLDPTHPGVKYFEAGPAADLPGSQPAPKVNP